MLITTIKFAIIIERLDDKKEKKKLKPKARRSINGDYNLQNSYVEKN